MGARSHQCNARGRRKPRVGWRDCTRNPPCVARHGRFSGRAGKRIALGRGSQRLAWVALPQWQRRGKTTWLTSVFMKARRSGDATLSVVRPRLAWVPLLGASSQQRIPCCQCPVLFSSFACIPLPLNQTTVRAQRIQGRGFANKKQGRDQSDRPRRFLRAGATRTP